MLLHCLSDRPSLLNIPRDFLIRLNLRRDKLDHFLSQTMRYANNPIQIPNNDIARMYRSILILALQPYRSIDFAYPDHLVRCRCADIPSKDRVIEVAVFL